MSGISTHVLDTGNGWPAAGLKAHLYFGNELLTIGTTDSDGRIAALLPADCELTAGHYRLVFDVAGYYPEAFFPEVVIVFNVKDTEARYHVPLLLSPFGYSTYRGT